MESSLELEDSRDEAARALFDQSHITLHALANGLTPSVVRRRLLAHVAGASPTSSPIIPSPSPLAMPSPLSLATSSHSLQSQHGMPPAAPLPPSTQYGGGSSQHHGASRMRHLPDQVNNGPIVAHIRPPRR